MGTHTFLLAGFGGQGILFMGKVIAYAGMLSGKEVSWLPSYGPAMRGGTANCSVTVSEEPVGSPLVLNPQVLVALNLPSFETFEKSVEVGGKIILDSSLINKQAKREDISVYYIPATKLAVEYNLKGFANMIVLGKLLKETRFTQKDIFIAALKKSIPSKKELLLEANLKAIELGYEYNEM